MKNILQALVLLIFLSVNAQQTSSNIVSTHSDIAFETSYFRVEKIKGKYDEFNEGFMMNTKNDQSAKFSLEKEVKLNAEMQLIKE